LHEYAIVPAWLVGDIPENCNFFTTYQPYRTVTPHRGNDVLMHSLSVRDILYFYLYVFLPTVLGQSKSPSLGLLSCSPENVLNFTSNWHPSTRFVPAAGPSRTVPVTVTVRYGTSVGLLYITAAWYGSQSILELFKDWSEVASIILGASCVTAAQPPVRI
jgi:hypothetical protein